MKHRIIKTAFLLVLLTQLSSCIFHRVHTDNRTPDRHHYRKGGRSW